MLEDPYYDGYVAFFSERPSCENPYWAACVFESSCVKMQQFMEGKMAAFIDWSK